MQQRIYLFLDVHFNNLCVMKIKINIHFNEFFHRFINVRLYLCEEHYFIY